MRISLNQIRTIVNIGQSNSLQEAANKTNISSIAIRKKINHIEEYAGCSIIQKSVKKLSLTTFGSDLFEKCSNILKNTEALMSEYNIDIHKNKNPLPNLTQLRILNALDNTCGYREISIMLGISTAAVSKSIKSLQKIFNTNLIKKENGYSVLSQDGRTLKNRALDLTYSWVNLEEWIVKRSSFQFGRITIYCPDEGIFEDTILPYLKDFHDLHPYISLEFLPINKRCVLHSDTKADVYWGMWKCFGNDNPGLVRKKLSTYDYGIYAAGNYLKNHGEINKIDDLVHHSFITSYNENKGNTFLYKSNSITRKLTTSKMKLNITSTRHLTELACLGLGILNQRTTSRKIIELLDKGKLTPILENYWLRNVETFSYYDVSSSSYKLTQTFIKYFSRKNDE